MSFGGTFYRHDQRLSLLTNTLASPVSDASGASAVMACPTAPKTFVNRASCVGATTCAPTAYASKLLQLNASTLRLFYTHANRVVYDIAGLRLEDPEDRDPCGGVETRWKRSSGACTSDTSLDSDSRSAIVAALQNATADSNPDVRDIIVSCGSAGGGGSAKGARSLQMHGNLMGFGTLATMNQLPQRVFMLVLMAIRELAYLLLRHVIGSPGGAILVREWLTDPAIFGLSMFLGPIVTLATIDGPRTPWVRTASVRNPLYHVFWGASDAEEREMYPYEAEACAARGRWRSRVLVFALARGAATSWWSRDPTPAW